MELVSLAHFRHDFWRKIFLLLSSITWLNLIAWLLLLREMFGRICIINVCWPDCDVINFEITLIFLIKPFFLHDQNTNKKI